jgi:hypothetical protein
MIDNRIIQSKREYIPSKVASKLIYALKVHVSDSKKEIFHYNIHVFNSFFKLFKNVGFIRDVFH